MSIELELPSQREPQRAPLAPGDGGAHAGAASRTTLAAPAARRRASATRAPRVEVAPTAESQRAREPEAQGLGDTAPAPPEADALSLRVPAPTHASPGAAAPLAPPLDRATPGLQGGSTRGPESVSHAAQASPGGSAADALRAYLRAVQRAIAQQAQAQYARGQERAGADDPRAMRLRITLGPSGRITGVALAQSSGSARLDRIVRSATARAQLPAPPPGVTRVERVLTLPIRFASR